MASTAALQEMPHYNKRIDIPLAGSSLVFQTNVNVPARLPLSTSGTSQKVAINCYPVESFPPASKKIHQFDVHFQSEGSSGAEPMKRGLQMRLWKSKAVQSKFGNFLWDGNKLAWAQEGLRHSENVLVDLDAEAGKEARPGRPNTHKVIVRETATIDLSHLYAYLEGKTSFDDHILQALNFFDHLLRSNPAQRLVQHKRSFFTRGNNFKSLGGGVEAWKGVYQSIRIVHQLTKTGNVARLMINADVANGMFFEVSRLTNVALLLTGHRTLDLFANACASGGQAEAKDLNKLRKVRVLANHRGRETIDEYTIHSFIFKDATQYEIDVKNPTGTPIKLKVAAYFLKKYNIRLQYPRLPLVKDVKGAVLPMEILTIKENQRYPFKLDERQTSEMIKFAATPPQERLSSIQNGLQMLNWGQDPMLQKYGVKINPNKAVVDARLLSAPTVKFANGEAKPGTSGRWDLKGKKFLAGNPVPLKSWGVCVISNNRGKPEKSVVDNFIRSLVTAYIAHGGQVVTKNPYVQLSNVSPGRRDQKTGKLDDGVSEAVLEMWNKTGSQYQARPQMLVFILPDKNATIYHRIKRSTDCRFGVVSQCVQYNHAQKCAPQYISNVLMKFNCKLGGVTCRAVGAGKGPSGALTKPTIIIGADVSHAAPGSAGASMAALTMSQDMAGMRYAASCETNGYRMEMIQEQNMQKLMRPLIINWLKHNNNGRLPERIIFLRDGVSEGQYPQVLAKEVHNMRQVIKDLPGAADVKFLVAVGSKRHHVRFFPERGDRNGNPFPGTLVETGVTHPFENDFYLCSHAAIKGTARPTHYHVLLNEFKMSNAELHTLIYEQCYQFQRATTPISQHPAIYYAHIASNRVAGHDPNYGDLPQQTATSEERTPNSIAKPLLPLPADSAGFPYGMWFI